MIRLLLAVSLLMPALARAESDAYGSLVDMASVASADKGPEAGEIPPDRSGGEEAKTPASEPAQNDEDSDEPEAKPEEKPAPVPAPAPKRAAAPARREDDGPSVAVPAAREPRLWTKVFSSLLPQPGREPSFEVAASTAPRPATAASAAGSAQGMLEVFSAAGAPYGAEETMRDAVAEKSAPAAAAAR